MVIAIHISRSLHLYQKAFNASFALKLAEMLPEKRFVFFCESDTGFDGTPSSNCTVVQMKMSAGSPLTLWYNYRISLPRLLKKYKADIFIPAGDFCCFRAYLPQFVIFHDREVWNPRLRNFLGQHRKETAAKASKIFSAYNQEISPKEKKKTIQLHPGPEQLTCLPKLLNDATEAEPTLDKMTYFLFITSSKEVAQYISIMKAFSIFKKWQKSSLRLIILSTEKSAADLSSLSSYKFREDVIVIKRRTSSSDSELYNGAYAIISLSGHTAALCGLRSIASGVPLLTLDNEGNRSFFEDSCLYVKETESDLGQKMILVYKDESLRSELIQKGLHHAAAFSPATCASEIAAAISGHN
jgi:glycosyltransferase involved in cell wall biosynthesis